MWQKKNTKRRKFLVLSPTGACVNPLFTCACAKRLEGWLKPKIATRWCIQSITLTLSDLVDLSSLHSSLKLSLSSPLLLTERLHPFSHPVSSLCHLPALWGRARASASASADPFDLWGAKWEASAWACIKRDSWRGAITCNYGGCD